MALGAIGAGIGVVSSVAQGASSKKGAKQAAQIQQANADKQNALLTGVYNDSKAQYAPEVTAGNLAGTAQTNYLGLTQAADGSSPTDQLRATPGYQFLQSEAANAINTNAYASGTGDSGATLKALQARAMNIADTTGNNYFSQLGTIANQGMSAKGAISQLGSNYGAATGAVNGSNANAQSSAVQSQAQAFNTAVNGVAGAVSSRFGSSYNAAPVDPGPINSSFASYQPSFSSLLTPINLGS
jgi:hypothetical protein